MMASMGRRAKRSHAYAKALYYQELKFHTSPTTCYESLITINRKLNHYDAAHGILKMAQKMQLQRHDLYIHEAWLERLGQWDEALKMYNKNLEQDPNDMPSMVGKVKCLHSIGQWEDALGLCTEYIERIESYSTTLSNKKGDSEILVKASVVGARAVGL